MNKHQAARLGSNMPDMSARVELKRLEHERQRLLQRKLFEDQMRALEQQQAQELLSIPYDPNVPNSTGMQLLAVSAPTTPPRVNAILNGDNHVNGRPGRGHLPVDAESLTIAVGSAADKRRSVTYAPSVNLSPDMPTSGVTNGQNFSRPVTAKSMPASRRTSASSHDEELASHLQGLTMSGERSNRASPIPTPVSASILARANSRFNDDQAARYASTYNAGMMLDEQLDQEMHSACLENFLKILHLTTIDAMRNLPTSDDDKYHGPYASKVSTSSAALDLAHISQTSPRSRFHALEAREKSSSEWPQFIGGPRGPDGLNSRTERRTVTNPNVTLSAPPEDHNGVNAIPTSATPLLQPLSQVPNLSHVPSPSPRRGSPPSLLDGISSTARSVPGTPLGVHGNTNHLKAPQGSPNIAEALLLNTRLSGHHQMSETSGSPNDLQASLSRMNQQSYDNPSLAFSSMKAGPLDEQQYGLEFDVDGGLDNGRYSAYSSNHGTANTTSGSTALYHHNGSRYGLGLPGRPNTSVTDNKMNGLHGPKHKRGDMDREFNRFAGTRLEDLKGEIPALCKDQHGCRYLQKKLEEGNPDHRDMIFFETFKHFAELMTDPFGNYLCQKLLEYSTDEQRNLLCDSVAQDLVNISLNMHGTRAVQKMVDFLSTRRQAKVATHRHGCCVLQRCIDHASDHQRVQLVTEITYHALTLVQDPYGNYVVQYILDLNDNRFSDAVIRQFIGNVCALSVQKFSSNVIEKCIRVAEHNTRKVLIDELLNRTRLEKLLRDSYGNYCVQTALDYAEPGQRALLVDGIRPILPLIRNTPYGKRIQNKLQREHLDNYGGYHVQPTLGGLGLSNQGMGVSHGPGGGRHPSHHSNPLADIYAGQNGLYSMTQSPASFNQHLAGSQLHGLQPQSIDGYVLQSNSSHNQSGLSSHSHGGGFSGSPFTTPFAGTGVSANSLVDPYQRNFQGYAM
ncbi:hypothetical protein C0992_000863 [Termitomyces sp. T32_za158]|nr:hypothetical protein C0992_000863 [Termitomyces sp. T32_za158]